MFHQALDAASRRLWDQRRFQYVIAGGESDDFPAYEGSEEEAFTDDMWEKIESDLESNPLVRHMP